MPCYLQGACHELARGLPDQVVDVQYHDQCDEMRAEHVQPDTHVLDLPEADPVIARIRGDEAVNIGA